MENNPVNPVRVSDSRPVLPHGFKASGIHAGIRRKGTRLDLGLIVAEEAFPAAAVYTQNRLTGAHVGECKRSLERSGGKVRALLVNSGNGTPATYEVNGRQYVVIAATGNYSRSGQRSASAPSAYVAFALPK